MIRFLALIFLIMAFLYTVNIISYDGKKFTYSERVKDNVINETNNTINDIKQKLKNIEYK